MHEIGVLSTSPIRPRCVSAYWILVWLPWLYFKVMDFNSDTYWFYIIEAGIIGKLLFSFSLIFHFQNNHDVGSGFRPNIPNFRFFDWPYTDPRLVYPEKTTFPTVESVLKSLLKRDDDRCSTPKFLLLKKGRKFSLLCEVYSYMHTSISIQ